MEWQHTIELNPILEMAMRYGVGKKAEGKREINIFPLGYNAWLVPGRWRRIPRSKYLSNQNYVLKGVTLINTRQFMPDDFEV